MKNFTFPLPSGLSQIIEKKSKWFKFLWSFTYLWKGYFHDENTVYKNIKSVIPGVIEYDLYEKSWN